MVEAGGQYTHCFRSGLDYAFILGPVAADAERVMPCSQAATAS